MTIAFEGATGKDELLLAWLAPRFAAGDAEVHVEHCDRADATVAASDLVNSQVTLLDGRRVRVLHSSPEHRGDPVRKFVRVEKPRENMFGPALTPMLAEARVISGMREGDFGVHAYVQEATISKVLNLTPEACAENHLSTTAAGLAMNHYEVEFKRGSEYQSVMLTESMFKAFRPRVGDNVLQVWSRDAVPGFGRLAGYAKATPGLLRARDSGWSEPPPAARIVPAELGPRM
jgi:hypothetical protein